MRSGVNIICCQAGRAELRNRGQRVKISSRTFSGLLERWMIHVGTFYFVRLILSWYETTTTSYPWLIMTHWSLITDTSYQVSLSQAILYLILICWPGPGLTDGVLAEEVRWAGREQWATLWNSDPPTHFPGIKDQSNDCMRTGLTGQEWEVFHIREIDELGSH